jgi:aryl-alcohol dehydrogenase-like predicted oxidoreductase
MCHYSMYDNSETLLGKWFKKTGKRGGISLTNKFSIVKGVSGYSQIHSLAEYVKKTCAESLDLLVLAMLTFTTCC